MRSVRFLALGVALALVVGCDDETFTSNAPEAPPPTVQGVQAFLQVDNPHAQPGDQVHLYVRVQFGTDVESRLGSYTGRLTFDSDAIRWMRDVEIDDGLRVVNPGEAPAGLVRFAGAAARGFEDLTLYHGIFEVVDAAFLDGVQLEMEELSEALTLADFQPRLEVAPGVFQRQDPR